MGNPLVRFCEGQESNCDMEEILWHRRESRRKQRKQTSYCSHGRLLSTRNGLLPKSIFCEAYFGERFLFSELSFTAAQPMISTWWQGKSFSRVRQNRAIAG